MGKRTRIRHFFAAALLAGAPIIAHTAEPLALHKIMQDLGRNMQSITDGISREDWELVAKTAPLISEHPQPPVPEKMRILGFVGANVARFKGFDAATKEHARALGTAARTRDGHRVIAAFQKLQTSCYNCHSEFRQPFVEYFSAGERPARKEDEQG